jgi:hypothetical protein
LNNDVRILTSEERQIKILQFVRARPGWIQEEVFKSLAEYMSRKTFFKELDTLKERKEILVKNKNKNKR